MTIVDLFGALGAQVDVSTAPGAPDDGFEQAPPDGFEQALAGRINLVERSPRAPQAAPQPAALSESLGQLAKQGLAASSGALATRAAIEPTTSTVVREAGPEPADQSPEHGADQAWALAAALASFAAVQLPEPCLPSGAACVPAGAPGDDGNRPAVEGGLEPKVGGPQGTDLLRPWTGQVSIGNVPTPRNDSSAGLSPTVHAEPSDAPAGPRAAAAMRLGGPAGPPGGTIEPAIETSIEAPSQTATVASSMRAGPPAALLTRSGSELALDRLAGPIVIPSARSDDAPPVTQGSDDPVPAMKPAAGLKAGERLEHQWRPFVREQSAPPGADGDTDARALAPAATRTATVPQDTKRAPSDQNGAGLAQRVAVGPGDLSKASPERPDGQDLRVEASDEPVASPGTPTALRDHGSAPSPDRRSAANVFEPRTAERRAWGPPPDVTLARPNVDAGSEPRPPSPDRSGEAVPPAGADQSRHRPVVMPASPSILSTRAFIALTQPVAVTALTGSEPVEPSGAPALASQIVQAIRVHWGPDGGHVRLLLQPEHLGELAVSLKVEGGSVTAHLETATSEVRRWIETNEGLLRHGLATHDLRLDRLIVTEQDFAASPDAKDRGEPEEQQRQRGPSRRRRQHPEGEGATFEILV